MQQVLFWIPIKTRWTPEGIPVYAYGFMLFITFVVCVWFMARRAKRIGLNLPREKIQDLDIVCFIAGLAGARLVYMLQFGVPLSKFFRIWEGGIVLYGGIVGGTLGFILFHHFVLKKLGVSLYQLGDLAAPALCIGIAIGRVGCLLNGCCWGNVANPNYPAAEFPLLTAPAREMLVDKDGLQTVVGFLPQRDLANFDDVRTIVGKIEPDSEAAKAGLKEGDKIIKLRVIGEWQINGEVLIAAAPDKIADELTEALKSYGKPSEMDGAPSGEKILKFIIEKPEDFKPALEKATDMMRATGRRVTTSDLFSDLLVSWPRGRNSVQFVVERDGKEIELSEFTPRSIGLHPTQVYETISMILLLFVVLAFYPFRRHDGQVFVVWMVGYALHRFVNEILRTEPVEGLQMTLSQNISVLVLLGAIALEIFLRKTQPKLIQTSESGRKS